MYCPELPWEHQVNDSDSDACHRIQFKFNLCRSNDLWHFDVSHMTSSSNEENIFSLTHSVTHHVNSNIIKNGIKMKCCFRTVSMECIVCTLCLHRQWIKWLSVFGCVCVCESVHSQCLTNNVLHRNKMRFPFVSVCVWRWETGLSPLTLRWRKS